MKITQTALDMVTDSTKTLLGEYLDVVKKSPTAKLKDSIGHDFEFSQDMDDLFVADNVFTGLVSEREHRSFYLENFNLVVRLNELCFMSFSCNCYEWKLFAG